MVEVIESRDTKSCHVRHVGRMCAQGLLSDSVLLYMITLDQIFKSVSLLVSMQV
jgi:hypothetical protein